MDEEIIHLREYWLRRASAFLVEHMQRCGLVPVIVRVSCGWPSRGGLGQRQAVIRQCFGQQVCADGIPQIFISPRLTESVEVLGVLLHELVHASVGVQYKHLAPFSQAARKVGLTGPPTATVVGPALRPLLQEYVAQVEAYPHAAIVPQVKGKVGSRLRLYECTCHSPVKVRVARDDFQAQCLTCGGMFVQAQAGKRGDADGEVSRWGIRRSR